MKKKIVLTFSLIIIILGILLTYKLSYNIKIKSIYTSLVYIESINEDTITSGSGFVYKIDDKKNYIVTNYHVIKESSNIYVYNENKEKIKAELINYDEYNDIAILIIDDKLGLKKVNFSNSYKIGDKVFVVGTPLSIKNFGTISKGTITDITNLNYLDYNFNAIKVSAKTNYGNSGGPLLNSKGQVIGMMLLMDKTDDNISYAIPIDFVIDTIDKLEKRISLGATMTNTTNTNLLTEYKINIPNIDGVVILNINKNGILKKYSFQKGDIITSFNDKKINNIEDLRNELYKCKQGSIVNIEIYRDGSYYKKNIEL